MPIANCIIKRDLDRCEGDLIGLWSSESQQPAEHMTVNIIVSEGQMGKSYGAMATLYLPSLWSESAINKLQLGLSYALSKFYRLPAAEVFVTTCIVESGRVVEEGVVLNW